MKKITLFTLFLFLECGKRENYNIIPIKMSLIVVTPYDKKYDTGYAFEASILNNQRENITFVTPKILIEKLESDGKWLHIFDESPHDYLNRNKFYPNEGVMGGYNKYSKKDEIAKDVLMKISKPLSNKNLFQINGYGVHMTFLKKDSIMVFSTTMNNVLNVGVKFIPHETLKGKYRAFCKIKKERLFHTIKLWDDKNKQAEYDLPKYWGDFKFIENPEIKSDTIHFEIY